MEFLIFIGILVIIYTVAQFLIMKDKLEIQRLEFIIFLIPLIIAAKDYMQTKPSIAQWTVSLISSYIILSVFVFVFIKVAGLPMQTNCDFDIVKKLFDKDKSFSKVKREKNSLIVEYTDINDDIIKISKRSRKVTNITIKGNMKTMPEFRRTIITKLSKIDKGMSYEYYINGLVGGGVLIIIGIAAKLFFK